METSGADTTAEVEEKGGDDHEGINGVNNFDNEADDDLENDEVNTANTKSNGRVEVT